MKVLLLALAIASMSTGTQAQGYPARPITLIIPTAAGGGNDGIGRVVADRMSHTLGQQLVVENRAGASGTIATKMLREAHRRLHTLEFQTAVRWAWGCPFSQRWLRSTARRTEPDRGDRGKPDGPGDRQRRAGTLAGRVDRVRQEKPRQADIRQQRRRQPESLVCGTVCQHGRDQVDACSVPRPGSGNERPDRRSHQYRLSGGVDGDGQHPRRYNPAARHHGRSPPQGFPRIADDGRGRPPAAYSAEQRYGTKGACRHATADRSQAQRGAARGAELARGGRRKWTNEGNSPPGAPADYARDIDREEAKWSRVIRDTGASAK